MPNRSVGGRAKHAAAHAAIRQIATLGQPGKSTLPVILETLKDIVAHEKTNFVWVDGQCNGIDWHGPLVVPPEVMRFYLEQYHNRREAEEIPSNRLLMDNLRTDRSATLPGFRRSEFFNIIFRAGNNGHFLRLAVRDGTRPLGIFYLLRPLGSKDFTEQDERSLLAVAPWIAHALAADTPLPAGEQLVDAESGLLIADQAGSIQLLSDEARQLLHRAADVAVTHATLADHCFHWARPLVCRLVHALATAGGSGAGQAVPALKIGNPNGIFVFRAYWVASATPGGSRYVAIQIQRQIPLALRLLQSRRLRALPPREQHACLLLALGRSSGEIARQMGISRDGAIYHVRSIYNRLGVSRQEEVAVALLQTDT